MKWLSTRKELAKGSIETLGDRRRAVEVYTVRFDSAATNDDAIAAKGLPAAGDHYPGEPSLIRKTLEVGSRTPCRTQFEVFAGYSDYVPSPA